MLEKEVIMENNFLLTFDCTEDNRITSKYAWFESEEELRDFVKKNKEHDKDFCVNEAIEIKDDRQIIVE